MPGKIKSKAEQDYLAIHKPDVLHELSGGHIPKGLPQYAKGSKAKSAMADRLRKRKAGGIAGGPGY